MDDILAWLDTQGFEPVVTDETTHFLTKYTPPNCSLELTTTSRGELDRFTISCTCIAQRDVEIYLETIKALEPQDKLRHIVQWLIDKFTTKTISTHQHRPLQQKQKQIECKVIEENDDDSEAPGFEEGFYENDGDFDHTKYIPIVPHNQSRILTIYVWGKALRDKPPPQLQITKRNNYNAAVLHGKKSGVDWTKCGSEPTVRRAVMQSSGFTELLERIIRDVEASNHILIGINCRRGRHRSSTLAHLVKHCFYPASRIVFLEPRSKEQHKFEW